MNLPKHISAGSPTNIFHPLSRGAWWVWLVAAFALWNGVAQAQSPEVTARVCTEEAIILAEVKAHAQELEAAQEGINAILSGGAREDVHPGDLLTRMDSEEGGFQGLRPTWPDELLCGDLRSAYRAERERVDRAKAALDQLRASFWLALPSVARSELRRIIGSQQWLEVHIEPSNTHKPISDELKKLASLRWTYATLLPSLRGSITPAEANIWLVHWHDALDLADSIATSPDELSPELTEQQARELTDKLDHLRLHARAVALAFNRVRAYLWANHRDALDIAVSDHGTASQLMLDEVRAASNALHWLYLDTELGNVSATGEHRPLLWQLIVGAEYLLGLGALLILAVFARRTENFGTKWQETFATRSRGIRTRSQLVRLTAGLPQWLPWVTGWYGLLLLDGYFERAELFLLLPFTVIAQLYVVYGLLVLAGEWFLKRMAELAGVYLNEEELTEVDGNARQAARIVLLPWFAHALVRLTIHESLTLSILAAITWLALLLAFGALLRPWRDEFVSAIQYFLPSSFNKGIESLFHGLRFFILAPLSAPVLVAATVASFLHKSCIQFDWYRRLVARSFLIRSALPEDREELPHDETAFADYEKWFQQNPGLDVPCLPAQINDKLQESLERWLDQHSDENTLLLTGEKGSGKTTALHRLEGWLKESEEPLEPINLSAPPRITTADELYALLEPVLGVSLKDGPAELVRTDEERPPTVLVIDNAQNLFLRSVGGLSAWEALLSLTRARTRNIFWLVSIDNQGWAYLANVFGGQGQFSKVLRCRPWSQNEIRSLILSRNQQSGVRITYDEVLLSTRGPEAGSLRNAEQLYFSLLWDTCHGNPGLALRLWLSSVHLWEDTATVGLPEDVSTGFLERIDEEQFFVFASLAIHHNLQFEELLQSTAVPESTIRSAIRVGLDRGVIERGEDRRYRITPLWYYPLTRILARKNLLHE